MLGILVDRELLYKMDMCGRCHRRWRMGTHRPKCVKPTCVELSEVSSDGELNIEKYIAMGYVLSNPGGSADADVDLAATSTGIGSWLRKG